MRRCRLGFMLHAAASLAAALATAQLFTPAADDSRVPQHTAVYTTTLAQDGAPQITTTVIVTLLMPREQSGYPTDGTPVTGTAISQLSAIQANGAVSTWATTKELYWTLSGNSAPGADSTVSPPPRGANTRLTSVYTSTNHVTTDLRGVWISSERYEWFSTWRVTLVEAVETAYPATIIRTGYTHLEATMVGGNVAATSTYSETGTASYWRTTTMVQVAARPEGSGGR
ncbi:hypothetical protein B0T18DRAFT_417169 [Schizothecium vesticola]|uniref:Uncharacterized protein n=1 Tax=Schizothecium vesticola TaxID=314040 RepID=A0AA40BTJ4_9PEZI|nr:hypothetical protein B0T18DRAFT_417169 [Schizothecium vesticola]